MQLKCIIIEDELPAQNILINYISRVPELSLIGIFSDPLLAGKKIYSKETDLIFLDINLPQISGINFIKSASNLPYVILTTAHIEFAIEAYELDVMDYLVKPFSFDRFLKAVNKVITLTGKLNDTYVASTPLKDESSAGNNFVFITENKFTYKVDIKDILFIEGKKDYIIIHTPEKKYMFLDSLSKWEEKLKRFNFLRVHKSFIISLDHIQKYFGNTLYVNGAEIPIGPNYKKSFADAIQKNNSL
ncbi:MAG TPA: LytTR family DNA-binding domain-containing protein [Chitinophagaceae bacterium]|nr:LytTR family DNA-binding domain-containing protein [Chitinophagaceae bacterium]